jgi:hypothetical protein
MKNSRVKPAWMFGVLLVCVMGIDPFVRGQATPERHSKWLDCDVSWISSDYHTGPNFTAKVGFRGQPIPAVKVLLSKEDQFTRDGAHIVATDETDADGIAHFFAIPPGEYNVRVDADLLAPDETVAVGSKGTGDQVALEWPGAWIGASSLSGEIRVYDKPNNDAPAVREPFKYGLVELLDLRRGTLLGQTVTDGQGHYEFPPGAEGLYVLRVIADADNPHAFQRAVLVSSEARKQIPILEADKLCGGFSEIFEEGLWPIKTTESRP